MGLTLAASGIFGAIFSPIVGNLIAAFGWRSAILIISALVAVMVILPMLFLFVAHPDEVNEKPYGWKTELASEEAKKEEHRNVPKWVYVKAKLSKFFAVFGMEGAILSVVFPYIYDFTGSFNPIFVFGILCCIVALKNLQTSKKNLHKFSKSQQNSLEV